VAQRDAFAKIAPRQLGGVEHREALELGGRQVHTISFMYGGQLAEQPHAVVVALGRDVGVGG